MTYAHSPVLRMPTDAIAAANTIQATERSPNEKGKREGRECYEEHQPKIYPDQAAVGSPHVAKHSGMSDPVEANRKEAHKIAQNVRD
jgi:hypothetical protein